MTSTPTSVSPWHAGEQLIQQQLGVAERMEDVGRRVIRDFMPDQHRSFYAQLPFVVLGSVDAQANAWATVLEGQPGFMNSPTATALNIAAQPAAADPAGQGMSDGAAVGLLGIELHTRRRNRLNGVLSTTEAGFQLAVGQSFGNCPRYIQLRDFSFDHDPAVADTAQAQALNELDPAAWALIENADTFFVASYTDQDGQRQVDVSHRGGKPGFVRLDADGTLTIPDFNGNLFFSTLGNLLLNRQAGLLFVDFATGDVLQMTGEAEVIFDSPEIAAFQGAERLWTFRPRQIVRRPAGLALRWKLQNDACSDSSLMTGDWQQAEQRLRAAEYTTRWRALRVTRVTDESASIRSFELQPLDDGGLLPHLAGQYLPIRVQIPGTEAPLIRTYTLSVAPSDGRYRISVKRDGQVSGYLHDHLREGDTLEARAPAGDFTLDATGEQPVVLLAAGVGITPMLAMLRHLVYDGLRRQRLRPVTLFYAARTRQERAFDVELGELVSIAKGTVTLVRVLSDTRDAQAGIDYEACGRIDMPLLSRVLPFADYRFYLCGPAGFSQALYDGLRGYGIEDERIHAEAFGPGSLKRHTAHSASTPARLPPATAPVKVMFMDSQKEARWQPDAGTLLELAEARGLTPEFSCREGHCGTCRTRLLKGAVTYIKEPETVVQEDEVLICCAVPADPQSPIQLAL